MIIKYNITLSSEIIQKDIRRIINQIYKLLPMREEGKDWKKPLQTIIQELVGLKRLFLDKEQQSFLILLSKLEGLLESNSLDDFDLYRRVIFQCLSLLSNIERRLI